jgi:hypothetical protein
MDGKPTRFGKARRVFGGLDPIRTKLRYLIFQ